MLKRVVVVKARPGDKLVDLPGQRRPKGYYQRFGVTAESEDQALTIVRNYIYEDLASSIVAVDVQREPDFNGLDSEIKDRVHDTECRGLWYVSGRGFFMEEQGQNEEQNGSV